MKKITRMIAVLILSLIFTACAATQESVENFEMDYIGSTDYNAFVGYNFIMRDHDHGGTYDIIPVYGENRLDDMMIERYRSIEDEYKCTITLLEGDSDGLIVNIVSGLPKYADIMYDKINKAYGAIKTGAYLDLYSVSDLNLDSGMFGSASLLDSMTWNDELFVMYPATWANHFAHVLYYVPSTLEEASIADPHEYYEKGEWTWATFETVAGAYYDSRTENRNIIALNPIVTDCAIYSNGVTWTTIDENGKRVVSYNSPQTIQALEWLNKLYVTGYGVENLDWEANAKALMAHETAFYANYSWMGVSKDGGYIPTNLKEEFRWISFPQGPSGSEATGVLTFTNPFFLLSIETDTDMIGSFCTLLFSPLGESETDWADTFNRENFFDQNSYNYYARMLNSLVFDYSVFIGKTDILDQPLMQAVRGQKTPSEVLDSVEQQSIDALIGYFG